MKHDYFTRPVRSDRMASSYGHTRLGEPGIARGMAFGLLPGLVLWVGIGLAVTLLVGGMLP